MVEYLPLTREKGTHLPWWTLTTTNTLLFSKFTDSGNSYFNTAFVPSLNANYGLVILLKIHALVNDVCTVGS